ncbi:MAG: YafY family protein [Hyphomicrobiales bacterium]|nr:YafY family protein [Hyphomicrobiales bacterium]
MSRSGRLLDLIQTLRRHRLPVSGQALAQEHRISLRTLYRDIATLQAQGAEIAGQPGLGYVLKPGFMLPPLMFSEDELEALFLGTRWVADRGDKRLSLAGRNAFAKISAVLPDQLRREVEGSTLIVGPAADLVSDTIDLALVRTAIRNERKLGLHYSDETGKATSRTIWPFGVGYFDRVRVVLAWCELRQDFRHFRTDRMSGLIETGQRYPQRRHALLKEWRARQTVAPGDQE